MSVGCLSGAAVALASLVLGACAGPGFSEARRTETTEPPPGVKAESPARAGGMENPSTKGSPTGFHVEPIGQPGRLSRGTYTYSVVIATSANIIPGMPAGREELSESLTVGLLHGSDRKVIRAGSYWGENIWREDVVRSSLSGTQLAHRMKHYRSNTGEWRVETCSAGQLAMIWPTRVIRPAEWIFVLTCKEPSPVRFEIGVHHVRTERMKTPWGFENVLVVTTTIRQFYDQGASRAPVRTFTDWVSPRMGLPVVWEERSRDRAGRVVRVDRGTLQAYSPD